MTNDNEIPASRIGIGVEFWGAGGARPPAF